MPSRLSALRTEVWASSGRCSPICCQPSWPGVQPAPVSRVQPFYAEAAYVYFDRDPSSWLSCFRGPTSAPYWPRSALDFLQMRGALGPCSRTSRARGILRRRGLANSWRGGLARDETEVGFVAKARPERLPREPGHARMEDAVLLPCVVPSGAGIPFAELKDAGRRSAGQPASPFRGLQRTPAGRRRTARQKSRAATPSSWASRSSSEANPALAS